jgi:hypothetical protein
VCGYRGGIRRRRAFYTFNSLNCDVVVVVVVVYCCVYFTLFQCVSFGPNSREKKRKVEEDDDGPVWWRLR